MTQELHNKWEGSWQNKFLEKGTENGYGDLSAMISHVSEIEKEAYDRGRDELRNALAPAVKTVEEICRQARKEERDSLKKKVEEKYGKQGTMSGSLGYQGILAGIHAYKTEGDNIRDDLLSLLSEE